MTWLDAFAQDVQRFPDADAGGVPSSTRTGESHRPAASVSAERTGFASDKQKTFFERLLRDAGVGTQQVAEIVRFAGEALATDRLSKAIDVLKEGDRDQAVSALLVESAEWHRTQTEMPWEDDGSLPSA